MECFPHRSLHSKTPFALLTQLELAQDGSPVSAKPEDNEKIPREMRSHEVPEQSVSGLFNVSTNPISKDNNFSTYG